jgi:hypothetical protein
MSPEKNLSPMMNIDRHALIAALASPNIRANAEWCVACGASASAAPLIPDVLKDLGREENPVRELIRPDFVRDLAMRLSGADANADWCVACGASKGTPPDVFVSNPAALSDAEIDRIAARLLPALRN